MIKKKILHIAFTGLGGQPKVAINLARFGNTTDMHSNHEILFCGTEKLHLLNKDNCEQNKLKYYVLEKNIGIDLKFYFKLVKTLFKIKPDVIIANIISYHIFYFIYTFLKNKKIIFAEQHSIGLRNKFSLIHSKIAGILGSKTIVLTQEANDYFLSNNIIKKNKIKIIPNGLNQTNFKNPYNYLENKLHLGTVSRLQVGKDLETVIHAIHILKTKYPQLLFIIIGEGADETKLKNLVIQLNLQENIIFKNNLTNDELNRFYKSISIFILSTAGEGLPTTIVEAMHAGLPVIGSNVSGVKSVIENRFNGLLFEYQNIEDLINKIDEIIENKNNILNKFSHNTFEIFQKKYSFITSYNQYKELF